MNNQFVRKPERSPEEAIRQGVAELLQHVVMMFSEDRVPTFTQGFASHELLTPVTAEHCTAFIEQIIANRNLVVALRDVLKDVVQLVPEHAKQKQLEKFASVTQLLQSVEEFEHIE